MLWVCRNSGFVTRRHCCTNTTHLALPPGSLALYNTVRRSWPDVVILERRKVRDRPCMLCSWTEISHWGGGGGAVCVERLEIYMEGRQQWKTCPLNSMESWKHKADELSIWTKPVWSKIALLVLTKTCFKSCDLYLTGFPFLFEIMSTQSVRISLYFLSCFFLLVMENNALAGIRLNYMKIFPNFWPTPNGKMSLDSI